MSESFQKVKAEDTKVFKFEKIAEACYYSPH